jgi:hypothetical protein
MSLVWGWLWLFAVTLVGGLAAGFAGWLIRSKLRERRKARYFAELSAKYQNPRPALPVATEPLRPEEPARRIVTVEELVARTKGEGLPVRLKWDEDRPNEDDWPTGARPKI